MYATMHIRGAMPSGNPSTAQEQLNGLMAARVSAGFPVGTSFILALPRELGRVGLGFNDAVVIREADGVAPRLSTQEGTNYSAPGDTEHIFEVPANAYALRIVRNGAPIELQWRDIRTGNPATLSSEFARRILPAEVATPGGAPAPEQATKSIVVPVLAVAALAAVGVYAFNKSR